ncbi:MAG: hypothetical protein ACLPX9_14105 [Rhodomicrobium sp.]
MLAAAGAGAGPWATGAAFGAAAAIASWAGAKIAGSFAEGTGSGPRAYPLSLESKAGSENRFALFRTQSSAAPQDLALHDALTLSLILAASAVLGGIGAALLLPAGAALALATRRIARKRTVGEQDAALLLIVGVAMAGLCRPLGFQECAVAGVALAAVAAMKAGHSGLRLPRQQMWHIWGVSALMCAAIAAAGHGPAALPASLGLPLVLPFAAGAIYGAAAQAASRMFGGARARLLSAIVPFLSITAECALGSPAHLPQVAAAVLLAAALAGSRYFPAMPREPAVSAANAWPMGWA